MLVYAYLIFIPSMKYLSNIVVRQNVMKMSTRRVPSMIFHLYLSLESIMKDLTLFLQNSI